MVRPAVASNVERVNCVVCGLAERQVTNVLRAVKSSARNFGSRTLILMKDGKGAGAVAGNICAPAWGAASRARSSEEAKGLRGAGEEVGEVTVMGEAVWGVAEVAGEVPVAGGERGVVP